MVWHAHLLNPRDILEDCIRYDKLSLWETGIPLATIDPCIDVQTLGYSVSKNAPHHFQATTGFTWKSPDDDQPLSLQCPNCGQATSVAWTTLTTADSWKEPSPGRGGLGFTDPQFEIACPSCLVTGTHEALRVRKFRNDCNALFDKDLPMPGSVLNNKGRCDLTNSIQPDALGRHQIMRLC